jgi:hypothetical protein
VTGQPSRFHADQQWLEAMFTDLQRQVDDLSDQLQALTHLVHLHTVVALDGEQRTTPLLAPRLPQERRDG